MELGRRSGKLMGDIRPRWKQVRSLLSHRCSVSIVWFWWFLSRPTAANVAASFEDIVYNTALESIYSNANIFQIPICSVDPSYHVGAGYSSVAAFFATIQKAGDYGLEQASPAWVCPVSLSLLWFMLYFQDSLRYMDKWTSRCWLCVIVRYCGCLGRTDQFGIAIEDVYTDITLMGDC